MSIEKAVGLGLVGNELSKQITGSSDVSVGRSVVATGCGAAVGAVASGSIVVAGGLVGIAAAPVVVPLSASVALVSLVCSLFD